MTSSCCQPQPSFNRSPNFHFIASNAACLACCLISSMISLRWFPWMDSTEMCILMEGWWLLWVVDLWFELLYHVRILQPPFCSLFPTSSPPAPPFFSSPLKTPPLERDTISKKRGLLTETLLRYLCTVLRVNPS